MAPALGQGLFYGMIAVCATAITLGILHPKNFWLALVAVFSLYMVASGYRSLYLKQMHRGLRPARVDITLHGIAGVVNGGLSIWGLAHLILGSFNTQAVLFTVFGLIGTLMVLNGFLKFYRRRHDKREWLYGHMGGFLGGYIATVSAFSAVNLTMVEPVWLQWLWPTIIGVPLIFFWIGGCGSVSQMVSACGASPMCDQVRLSPQRHRGHKGVLRWMPSFWLLGTGTSGC